MTREWQPGHVALVDVLGEHQVAQWCGDDCQPRAAGWGTHPAEPHWHTASARFIRADNDARPLVVIDPEDRKQVERLWTLYFETATVDSVAALQAALREFANPKPPKPEEPSGWGAVVEDNTGAYWTLYAPEAGVWINYREGKRRWHEINVVRVLSDGVQS